LSALATRTSVACATASGLCSHGSSRGKSAISGRRSQTTIIRGISSAKRSRTMNSSLPRAADRRAEDFQSMAWKWSPG
jgi:hypothetical protein